MFRIPFPLDLRRGFLITRNARMEEMKIARITTPKLVPIIADLLSFDFCLERVGVGVGWWLRLRPSVGVWQWRLPFFIAVSNRKVRPSHKLLLGSTLDVMLMSPPTRVSAGKYWLYVAVSVRHFCKLYLRGISDASIAPLITMSLVTFRSALKPSIVCTSLSIICMLPWMVIKNGNAKSPNWGFPAMKRTSSGTRELGASGIGGIVVMYSGSTSVPRETRLVASKAFKYGFKSISRL